MLIDRSVFGHRLATAEAAMLHQLGQAAVAEAQRLVPVDTGDLKASIGYSIDGSTLQIYADMPYAAYVEFGTVRTPAQPYLRPAILSLRGFKLTGVGLEMGLPATGSGRHPGPSGSKVHSKTTRQNAKVNRRFSGGLIKRTKVVVRRHRPGGIA